MQSNKKSNKAPKHKHKTNRKKTRKLRKKKDKKLFTYSFSKPRSFKKKQKTFTNKLTTFIKSLSPQRKGSVTFTQIQLPSFIFQYAPFSKNKQIKLNMDICPFAMTSDKLQNYFEFIHVYTDGNKNVLTRRDCTINALQLLGVFNLFTSNTLRMTCAKKGNMSIGEISAIFTLASLLSQYEHSNDHLNRNKCFIVKPLREFSYDSSIMKDDNFELNVLLSILSKLKNNQVLFCGYSNTQNKHSFIMGKDNFGNLIMLDPQISQEIIVMNDHLINNYFNDHNDYYVLFESSESLTNEQSIQYMYEHNIIDD